MLIKEFLQMLRDPRMRGILFIAPVVQMTVLAFALTTDVTDINTAILDEDRTLSTREIAMAFTAGRYFRITEYPDSHEKANLLLDEGKVRAIIHFPNGFEKDLISGKTAVIQLVADGTDSNTTAVIFGYANEIIERTNQNRIQEKTGLIAGKSEPVQIAARAWYNPNMESKYFFVPGLIAIMLMLIGILMTSIAIVREKEIGTIEQVMVTPIRKTEFILGKTIPFMITGYIVMTLMLAVAILVFGIQVKGSILLLYGLAGIYIAGNLGIALFVSAISVTQQQALLTAFFVLMPGVLLSGFIFPIGSMPESIQYITYLNPMRWFLEILRGILQKGVGLESLWYPVTGQILLAVLFLTMAITRFRKTIS